jgi:hypothetical protein
MSLFCQRIRIERLRQLIIAKRISKGDHMRKTIRKLVCLFLCFVLIGSVFADWQAVGKIDHKRKVQVRLINGSSLSGTIEKMDGDTLTLKQTRGKIALDRSEVYEIRASSIGRTAMWGAIVGTGMGAFMGDGITKAGHSNPDSTQRAGGILLGALILSGVGAGIGALIGVVTGKHKTLYRAGE